jgi:hypothetical protein
MSDIEREAFEQAVADKWSDSYKFTRFGDEDYYDEVLEGMWWGWQAGRRALEGQDARLIHLLADIRFACGDDGKRMQGELVEYIGELARKAGELEGEPVGYTNQYQLDKFPLGESGYVFRDKRDDSTIPLYTHPASRQAASMPEANKAWASSDPSWLLAHLKEDTIFDTEFIGEMLAFAKAAASAAKGTKT